MNRFYLTILFTCFVSYCFSQSKDSNQLNDMISTSLELNLSLRIKALKDQNALDSSKPFILTGENFPRKFKLSDSIMKKYNVRWLNMKQYSHKALRKGVDIIGLLPIRIYKDELLISIVDIHLTKRWKKLHLDCPDYSVNYRFRYSCEQQKWELVEIEPSYSKNIYWVE